MTEAEFNTGKQAFINMLTPKPKNESTHVVSNIDPMQVKVLGEPKFGTKIGNNVMTDTRKIGNPNARDFYTYGKR